ncbi:MAG: BBE domain-containing protein [Thermoleophilia bacterium]
MRHLTPEFAAAAAEVIASGAIGWFQVRSVGGAVADVDPDATAYPHRAANFSVMVMGAHDDAVDAAWARLQPFVDGLYLSFDTRVPAPVAEAWPPATLARLRDLKAKYDPDAVFRDNFPLTPATRSPR